MHVNSLLGILRFLEAGKRTLQRHLAQIYACIINFNKGLASVPCLCDFVNPWPRILSKKCLEHLATRH